LGQNSNVDALRPVKLESPIEHFSSHSNLIFSKISIGGGHVLAIVKGKTKNNNNNNDDDKKDEELLVGCGWNEECQLIYNDEQQKQSLQTQTQTQQKNEDFPTFRIIARNSNPKIISVACGWSHSVVLKENGDCFLFGSFSLSTPKQQSTSSYSHKTTTKLSFPISNVKITSIACGLKHAIFISEKGESFSMGEGKFCALGYE